jgi:hypothetical protein
MTVVDPSVHWVLARDRLLDPWIQLATPDKIFDGTADEFARMCYCDSALCPRLFHGLADLVNIHIR